jgi:hypothetical protein
MENSVSKNRTPAIEKAAPVDAEPAPIVDAEPAQKSPSLRERLADYDEDLLLLEPAYFDSAIVGIVEQAGGLKVVVYDPDRCVELMIEHGGMSREDAEEYAQYNTFDTYLGPKTPAFLTKIGDML